MRSQRRFWRRTRHWMKVASMEWRFIEIVARQDLGSTLVSCESVLAEARQAGGKRILEAEEGLDDIDGSQFLPSDFQEELFARFEGYRDEYAFRVLQEWDGASVFSIQQAKVISSEKLIGPKDRREQTLSTCLVAWTEEGLEEAAEWWLNRIFRAKHLPAEVEGSVQGFAEAALLPASERVRPGTKGRAFAATLAEWLAKQHADVNSAALPLLLTMEPTYQFNPLSFNARKRYWLNRMTSGFAWAFIGNAAVYETLTLVDGSIYQGEHRNGRPHGSGEQKWADGRHYVGDFKDGLPHGTGVMAWPTGDQLESRWRNGRSRGLGVMTLPDGTSYHGKLRFGRQHGRWIVTAPNGRKFESCWFLGKELSSRRLN